MLGLVKRPVKFELVVSSIIHPFECEEMDDYIVRLTDSLWELCSLFQ